MAKHGRVIASRAKQNQKTAVVLGGDPWRLESQSSMQTMSCIPFIFTQPRGMACQSWEKATRHFGSPAGKVPDPTLNPCGHHKRLSVEAHCWHQGTSTGLGRIQTEARTHKTGTKDRARRTTKPQRGDGNNSPCDVKLWATKVDKEPNDFLLTYKHNEGHWWGGQCHWPEWISGKTHFLTVTTGSTPFLSMEWL